MVQWSERNTGAELSQLGELLPQVLARHGLAEGGSPGGRQMEQGMSKPPVRPGEPRRRAMRGRRARRRTVRGRGGA